MICFNSCLSVVRFLECSSASACGMCTTSVSIDALKGVFDRGLFKRTTMMRVFSCCDENRDRLHGNLRNAEDVVAVMEGALRYYAVRGRHAPSTWLHCYLANDCRADVLLGRPTSCFSWFNDWSLHVKVRCGLNGPFVVRFLLAFAVVYSPMWLGLVERAIASLC